MLFWLCLSWWSWEILYMTTIYILSTPIFHHKHFSSLIPTFLSLTPNFHNWYQHSTIDINFPSLIPTFYHWHKISIIDTNFPSVTTNFHHWHQFSIIQIFHHKHFPSLTPTFHHWHQLFIIGKTFILFRNYILMEKLSNQL